MSTTTVTLRRAICVFACDPRIEAARKPIAGPHSALAHAALLAATMEEMRPVAADLALAWRGDESRAQPLAARLLLAQRGRGIGERVAHTVADLKLLGYGRVALVVADCPTLHGADVAATLDQLDDCEIAVIPATDGGINAIALRLDRTTLPLETLPWETRRLIVAVRSAADAAELRLVQGPALDDIDSADALTRFLESQPESLTARLLRKSLAHVTLGRPATLESQGLSRSRLFGVPFSSLPT